MESESDKSSDGDFVGGEVVSEDDFEASCDDSLAPELLSMKAEKILEPSRAGVVLQKAVSDWTILVAKHVSDCSGLHGPCEFRLFDSSEYHAPSFVLEFICLGCQEEFLFRGDDGTVKDRFLASFLDCGTGYTTCQEVSLRMDMPFPSQTTSQQVQDKMAKQIEPVFQKSLEKYRSTPDGKPHPQTSCDVAWSQRRGGNDAFHTVMTTAHGGVRPKIIAASHVSRHRSSLPRREGKDYPEVVVGDQNFYGTSNAMGPKVTKQSWDSIFDTHPNFETITHTTDGDDSAWKISFNAATEQFEKLGKGPIDQTKLWLKSRDPGHMSKNLQSNMEKMAKVNPLLKGFSKLIKRDFNFVIRRNKERKGGLPGLHKGLDVVMNHTFFGIHDGCDDKCRFNMFPKLQAYAKELKKSTKSDGPYLVDDIVKIEGVRFLFHCLFN